MDRPNSFDNSGQSYTEQANGLHFDGEYPTATNNINGDINNILNGTHLLKGFDEELVESTGKTKKFRKMYLAALVALMNAVCMGFSATYTATALADMKSWTDSKVKPTDDQEGWIGSLLPVGALFGGMTAGLLAQMAGRRGALIISAIPFLGGWLCMVFATSVDYLYAGRLIVGFCCGLVSVTTPMYLIEISTPEVRGLLGASFQLFVTIGVLLVSCFGAFLHWNWLATTGAIMSLISALVMTRIPESPRWLMSKGKVEAAKRSVFWLQGNFLDVSEYCNAIQEDINNQPQGRITFQELLMPDAYKPALLSFALMFFQQCSGINAILFYTVSIFEKAGNVMSGTLSTILVAMVQVAATLVSSVLMDKAGRKILLLISGLCMGISFGIFSTFEYIANQHDDKIRASYGWVPIVCLIIFISAFSLGFGPIPWLMVSEMTTGRLRGLTSAVATALNWAFAFAVTKSFHAMSDFLSDWGAYWIYMIICILSCAFTMLFLPETKGKTFDEIQDYFRGKRKSSLERFS